MGGKWWALREDKDALESRSLTEEFYIKPWTFFSSHTRLSLSTSAGTGVAGFSPAKQTLLCDLTVSFVIS